MATKGQINVDFALRYVGAVGANRYVANVSRYSTIAYRDIVQYAARAAHVPESAVDVAMEALFDALSYFVLNGHNVKIDGIGTFAFGVNAKAEINEEDAGANSVHRLKILYLPEMDLRREMNNVVVTTSWSNPGNLVEDTAGTKLSLTYIGFGSTKSNCRSIPINGMCFIPKGKLFLELEGTGLNKKLGIVLEGWYQTTDPDEGEIAQYWLLQYRDSEPGIGSARYSRGFGHSIFVFDVPNDTYLYQMGINVFDPETGNADPAQYQQRNYSIPDSGVFVETAADCGRTDNIYLNSVKLVDNMTMLPDVSGKYNMIVNGPNVRSVISSVVVTGASIVAQSSQINSVRYNIIPASGATSFTIKARLADNNYQEKTYTISLGSSNTQVVVSALSANGVSIANGGTSTVVEGESYNFTLSGQNLNSLAATDIRVPNGASIRNFAKSASSATFTMDNATTGDIVVSYSGQEIFRVTVESYNPATGDAAITSIGGVGNNGTYNARGLSGNSLVLPIVGTDLDQLSAGSFRFLNGSTFELSEGTATARDLTIRGTLTTGQLLVMNGETTIFKLNLDFGDEFVL